jgi:hypothetical protein
MTWLFNWIRQLRNWWYRRQWQTFRYTDDNALFTDRRCCDQWNGLRFPELEPGGMCALGESSRLRMGIKCKSNQEGGK